MLAAHLLKLRKMAKALQLFQACASILKAMLFVVVIESSINQTTYNDVFAATNTSSTSSVSSSIPKAETRHVLSNRNNKFSGYYSSSPLNLQINLT